MARKSSGVRIRLKAGKTVYTAVFWSDSLGRQVEVTTGESDAGRAQARAKQIFAESVRLGAGKARSAGAAPVSTEAVGVEWLRSRGGLLYDGTRAIYAGYLSAHLVPAFPSLIDVNAATVRDYQVTRLGSVRAQTVRHELSCLRGLLRYAVERGYLASVPDVPPLPHGATGVAFGVRRRSKPDELSPEEVEAFLAALPENTPRLGPVRARFVIEYETALRPRTLDRLSSPEHWRPGQDWLDLEARVLKGRRAVQQPISDRAVAALESAYHGPGVLFGRHDYREVVAAAAKAALAPEKAARFAACHLRSAAITHLLEGGATLPAAQAFALHERATTTDRYVRARTQRLREELARQGRSGSSKGPTKG